MNVSISSKDSLTSTIRLGLLGEMVGLWTIEACFMIALVD